MYYFGGGGGRRGECAFINWDGEELDDVFAKREKKMTNVGLQNDKMWKSNNIHYIHKMTNK